MSFFIVIIVLKACLALIKGIPIENKHGIVPIE